MSHLTNVSARLLALTLALALLISAAACDDLESIFPPPETDEPLISVSPLLSFEDFSDTGGTSRLIRAGDEIAATLEAEGLESGHAVTLWVVIFNRPEHCSDSPCLEEDLFNSDTESDVIPGGGTVVAASGNATFKTHRWVGDDTAGSLLGGLGMPSPGLLDARGAEIHFVLRDHGPLVDGLESEMVTTFNGGCQNPGEPFPDPLPPSLGEPGPNTCVDAQFAVHLPEE